MPASRQPGAEPSGAPARAAAYVRMSTEHQQYSTDNQLDAIRRYAAERGFEIVRVYSDEGRSGLSLAGREGIGRLIADVRAGNPGFAAILVYDVSRWGRFQNADESAHYEFTCWQAGIAVHFCAEQFENDGSPVATIVKGVKRAMAGEYSRELSVKVFQGACRLIRMGYRQGGTAGYGLRRMLVDGTGAHKGILERGQQKSIQTDRVILVPGPPEEVENVRWIYRAFVTERRTEAEIARLLDARGIRTDLGQQWTRGTVHQVLTNEKYIGNNLYHRTSFKLKGRHVENPPDLWVRAEGVFGGVVDATLFAGAREIILARSRHLTDAEMLDGLRTVLDLHGRISGVLIDEAGHAASSAAYRHRFGSLLRAYRLIGYAPETDYRFIEINRHLRRLHPEIVAGVIGQIETQGSRVTRDPATDLLRVNGEFTVSVVLARCQHTPAGSPRWLIRLETGLRPDITVAVRMDADNQGILDYYLLPASDISAGRLRLTGNNGISLDAYRFGTLDFLFALTRRTTIKEAA